MKPAYIAVGAFVLAILAAAALAASEPAVKSKFFKPVEKVSQGTVTIEGSTINYQAIASTLIVHPKDWDDADASADDDKDAKSNKDAPAEASMFLVYYAKR